MFPIDVVVIDVLRHRRHFLSTCLLHLKKANGGQNVPIIYIYIYIHVHCFFVFCFCTMLIHRSLMYVWPLEQFFNIVTVVTETNSLRTSKIPYEMPVSVKS